MFRRILLILFFGSAFAASAQYKLAIVDLDSVVRSMHGYADSIQVLNSKTQRLQKEYDLKQAFLLQQSKAFQAAKDTLPPIVAQAWLADLKDKVAQLDSFKADANRLIEAEQVRMLIGFYQLAEKELAVLANELKYTVVLRKKEAQPLLAYLAPEADITEKLIKKVTIK